MTKCFKWFFFQCSGKKRNQSKRIVTTTTVRASQSNENHFRHVHSHWNLLPTERGCPPSHTLHSAPSQSLSRHNGTKSSDSKQEAAPKNAGRQRRLTRKYPLPRRPDGDNNNNNNNKNGCFTTPSEQVKNKKERQQLPSQPAGSGPDSRRSLMCWSQQELGESSENTLQHFQHLQPR